MGLSPGTVTVLTNIRDFIQNGEAPRAQVLSHTSDSRQASSAFQLSQCVWWKPDTYFSL